jgi:hypothetical protein
MMIPSCDVRTMSRRCWLRGESEVFPNPESNAEASEGVVLDKGNKGIRSASCWTLAGPSLISMLNFELEVDREKSIPDEFSSFKPEFQNS